MVVKLKYGRGVYELQIPEEADVAVLHPASLPILENLVEALKEALDSPLERPPFDDLVRNMAPRKVAIAVPDETRPTPLSSILPLLLKRLYRAAPELEPSDVTIIVGGGLHQPLDSLGLTSVIQPSITPGCRVIAHDALNARMVNFGKTSRGTPVMINAEFAGADLRIVIGQIDPHQFVGFTGGSKGVVIGAASAQTIEHNHSLMFDPGAQVGRFAGNPVREDMNEAGRMVGIHLAVNMVLDSDKKPVGLFAGDPEAVLAAGADTCAAIYGVRISRKFDIVIASCGGHPKDICLYQAQKGLNLASHVLKPGGRILLLAACPQGVGDDVYFEYVCKFETPQEVLADFRRLGFKMGAHKAFLFGRTLDSFDVAVASELDAETLEMCHLRAAEPSKVVRFWVEAFEGRPRVAVVPNANTTFFVMQSE
ncbi:MAG: nickel-dependent lactate racemase [Desulfomonile tiedjei]|uniref:Nickel-dependent lactate racemase n=1 Tax=Desulfomonile tiedjei TaxID=2358 RepID=A0A9D6Z5W0_9BACT|nr:nickel-dependent lactate racemase [Desulfomonile tiedjei]